MGSGSFLKYLENDKWYHGTSLSNWKKLCELGIKVDYNIGNELVFGFGFYMCPSLQHTERFIESVLSNKIDVSLDIPIIKDEDKSIAVIIEFEVKPIEWHKNDTYNFKILNKYDDEFAEFVFHNRLNNLDGENHHEYDFIFGVMSDSLPIILLQKFKNGEINKEDVIDGLKKPTSCKQISLHRQDICDIIVPTRVYRLDNREELNVNDYFNFKC